MNTANHANTRARQGCFDALHLTLLLHALYTHFYRSPVEGTHPKRTLPIFH